MKITLLLLLCVCALHSKAQFQGGALLGINAGAPIPSKFEKGASGKLQPGFCIGAYYTESIYKKWHLDMYLFAEQKRASYVSPVFYDYIIMAGDTINTFQGVASGSFRNTYLSLPVNMHYMLSKKLSLGIGAYASLLLKGQHNGTVREGRAGLNGMFAIADQNFDESKNVKTLDYGASMSIKLALNRKFNLVSLSTIGLGSMHQKTQNFNDRLRNVYTGLMVGYRLR